MGAIGGLCPVPFEVGGGDTEDERVYQAMRRAVGDGGVAVTENGIDGLWRRCKAGAIASLNTFPERAALQAFPHLATDHIPVYEEELGITPAAAATDVARRADITAAYTRKIQATGPDLATQLSAIDPRTSLLDIPRATSGVVALGKAFQPQDGTPSYGGGRLSTSFPNFSTEFHVPVILNLGASPVPGPGDQLIIARIKRTLRDVLPAWVSSAVITGSPGFYLDVSPLDYTAMS